MKSKAEQNAKPKTKAAELHPEVALLEANRLVNRLERHVEILRRRYQSLFQSVRPIIRVLDRGAIPPAGTDPIGSKTFSEVFRDASAMAAAYTMLRAISHEEGLSVALTGAVRTLLSRPESKMQGRLLAFAILREGVSTIPAAICLAQERQFAAAYALLQAACRSDVLALAAPELAQSAYATDALAARFLFSKSEVSAGICELPQLAKVVGVAAAAGDFAGAQHLAQTLLKSIGDRHLTLDISTRWIAERLRMRSQANEAIVRSESIKSRRFNLAVIDYKHDDYFRVSRNLGDYIQTLAFLATIARFDLDVSADEPGLETFMACLKGRVRTDRRISTNVQLRLVAVDRDASSQNNIVEPTWMIAFGWYMSRCFDIGFNVPFHGNLRPLFLSFHIHLPELLTEATVAFLRQYSPIGCRDWFTVYLLLGLGVEAFFSGCLTTTLDSLMTPPEKLQPIKQVAYVDVAAGADHEGQEFTHQEELVRTRGLVENLAEALSRLDLYRTEYAEIVTSRLHCYLPCLAVGKSTSFHPANPSDIRFEGLVGLDTASLKIMRNRLLTKVKRIVDDIAAQTPEAKVYARWRVLCAEEVADARQACICDPPLVLEKRALDQISAHATQHAETDCALIHADTIEVAIAVDAAYLPVAAACIRSILAHTHRPLRIWVLSRGLPKTFVKQMREAFPLVIFQVVDCSGIDLFAHSIRPPHISVSSMDRLLMSEFIPVDRVVYLDVDTIVLADLGEIFDTPLDGVLGARPRRNANLQIHHEVEAAARRLPPLLANELRRRTLTFIPATRATFNAGLMVLDLARMRGEQFCARHLPYAIRFLMNDQEIMNLYAKGLWTLLPEGWNVIVGYQPSEGAKMLHWAGPVKPWADADAPMRDVWARFDVDQTHGPAR